MLIRMVPDSVIRCSVKSEFGDMATTGILGCEYSYESTRQVLIEQKFHTGTARRRSREEEANLAMRCLHPSVSNALGRAPPTYVPCSRARSRAGVSGSPFSIRSVASAISANVAVSSARTAYRVADAWKSSAPMRSELRAASTPITARRHNVAFHRLVVTESVV